MKVYARMIDDSYRSLTPEFPYEVEYRIENNHIKLVGSPARYLRSSFVFTLEYGTIIDVKDLPKYVRRKTKVRKILKGGVFK